MALNPLITTVWKQESAPHYLRLIQLGEKAQDEGLTPEEEAEYREHKEATDRLLSRLLQDTRTD